MRQQRILNYIGMAALFVECGNLAGSEHEAICSYVARLDSTTAASEKWYNVEADDNFMAFLIESFPSWWEGESKYGYTEESLMDCEAIFCNDEQDIFIAILGPCEDYD